MQNDEKDKIRVALDDFCLFDIKQAFDRLIDIGNCLSF